ncbi:Uncharacterised protein [Chlamydia trachomatis]|nr:Uncharacterised protein [Chlamydia trachomatis]
MSFRDCFHDVCAIAFGDVRQSCFCFTVLFSVVTTLVTAFFVGLTETGLGDDRAGGGRNNRVRAIGCGNVGSNTNRRGKTDSVGHLRGNRTLPDQVIESQLLTAQLTCNLCGGTEVIAGGADSFVSFLRSFRNLAVHARLLGDRGSTVKFCGLRPCRGNGLAGQCSRIGSHVGDVTGLVQGLSGTHCRRSIPVQLSRGFLLQCGRCEWCCRTTTIWLLRDRINNRLRGCFQRGGEVLSKCLVQVQDVSLFRLVLQNTLLAEVGTCCYGSTINVRYLRVECVTCFDACLD